MLLLLSLLLLWWLLLLLSLLLLWLLLLSLLLFLVVALLVLTFVWIVLTCTVRLRGNGADLVAWATSANSANTLLHASSTLRLSWAADRLTRENECARSRPDSSGHHATPLIHTYIRSANHKCN